MDLDERQAASLRGHVALPDDLEELRQRLGAQTLLVGDSRLDGLLDVLGKKDPLELVAIRAIARRIGGIDVVDDRSEEVEPEPAVIERERTPAGDDDPVVPLVVLAELQEDSLERPAVDTDAVEEKRDPGSRLAKGPGLDEVDDRGRREPCHRPRQRFVRSGQHEVVEEKHPGREKCRGAERRPVNSPGAHAAGPHRDELRVAREPSDPDQDPEQERHRQRQHENPRNR